MTLITRVNTFFGEGLDWFPQDYAPAFYYAKGFLALVSTVLLIMHMSRSWHTIATLGQRLRYITLLYFAALVTFASVEQVHTDALVNWRNLGAILGMALLLVTMVVSVREDRKVMRR